MPSYTEVAISGYNSSPPVDNGAVTEANRIKWSTIKTKLGDPLNTVVAALDNNIAAAITTITSNLSTADATLTSVNATYTTVSGVLYAPQSTVALFAQAAAPTGWTKGSTHDNKALRLTTGAVGTGGSKSFTSTFTSRTLTEGNVPAHTHTWSSGTLTCTINDDTLITSVSTNATDSIGSGGTTFVDDLDTDADTISATSSVSSTSSGTTGSGTAFPFAIRYVDVILATKD